MKIIMSILILCLILCLSIYIVAQANTTTQNNEQKKPTTKEKSKQESESLDQETGIDDIFPNDYDIFLRKKENWVPLPHLSKSQKIIWAFRLSESNTFL
jgi:hypothetical protein